jgi:hypothetical protein
MTGNNGHAAVIMRAAIGNVEFSQFFKIAVALEAVSVNPKNLRATGAT